MIRHFETIVMYIVCSGCMLILSHLLSAFERGVALDPWIRATYDAFPPYNCSLIP
jgi:hypothetical protein